MGHEACRARSVWMLVSLFYPVVGGDERSVQWFARRLIEQHGWPVRVLTRRHGARLHGLPSREVVDGIPVVRVSNRGWGKVSSLTHLLGGLWHLLRYGRGGIYQASDLAVSSWLATIARYLLGGRSIIKMRTGRYRYERLFSSFFSFSSALSRWYFITPLRLADRIVVVSQEVGDFVRELGVRPERIVRIPNAVDTGFFQPASAEEKKTMRRQLGLAADKAIFLYVGRLNRIKGVDVLLRGWSLLPEQARRNALLVLVGGQAGAGSLLDMIPALNLGESVVLAGARRDVRDYYWAADVFVLASRTEGLSHALLEAMSCGLPAVVSNAGGSPDVVQDGANGLLFESENHGQLAQRLASMMDMRERWAEMGAHARQTVVDYADLDVCVRLMSRLYEQLT